MKKMFISILLLLVVTFASCSTSGANLVKIMENEDKIADKSFQKIIYAINAKDESELSAIFSENVRRDKNLSQDAVSFIDYIQGDVISFTSASETGQVTDCSYERGKMKKVIQSAFCINTTSDKYYVAVKECVIDEFEVGNTGILSIYIINADNWTNEYVYRGDGKWTNGINIANSGE